MILLLCAYDIFYNNNTVIPVINKIKKNIYKKIFSSSVHSN